MPPPAVYIAAAKRTPFGSFGGTLRSLNATKLATVPTVAALKSLPLSVSSCVDSVIFGNVLQTCVTAPYLARHVALSAGLGVGVPALTVNRLCGSGFESVVVAATAIRAGDAHVVVAGGAENMSMAPHTARGLRWSGARFGVDVSLEDTLYAALTDRHPAPPAPMGVTAENLARDHGIPRAACDEYALMSQARWKAAHAAGRFDAEIAPVSVPGKSKAAADSAPAMTRDEHPRPDSTTLEMLARLPCVFQRDGGTVTAGNASGIADGAAALVVVSQHALEKHGLAPLARVRASRCVGVDPTRMGIGPVPAIQALLGAEKLQVSDIEMFEVNEAFAPQYLAVEKVLGLNRDRTNVHGGAIAMGHPLGASGARILGHLAHVLSDPRNNVRRAVGAACIGGGQGIAVLLERVE